MVSETPRAALGLSGCCCVVARPMPPPHAPRACASSIQKKKKKEEKIWLHTRLATEGGGWRRSNGGAAGGAQAVHERARVSGTDAPHSDGREARSAPPRCRATTTPPSPRATSRPRPRSPRSRAAAAGTLNGALPQLLAVMTAALPASVLEHASALLDAAPPTAARAAAAEDAVTAGGSADSKPGLDYRRPPWTRRSRSRSRSCRRRCRNRRRRRRRRRRAHAQGATLQVPQCLLTSRMATMMMASRNSYVSWYNVIMIPPVARVLKFVLWCPLLHWHRATRSACVVSAGFSGF